MIETPFTSTNAMNNHQGQSHIHLSSTLSIIYFSNIALLNALVALLSQRHFFIIAVAFAVPME